MRSVLKEHHSHRTATPRRALNPLPRSSFFASELSIPFYILVLHLYRSKYFRDCHIIIRAISYLPTPRTRKSGDWKIRLHLRALMPKYKMDRFQEAPRIPRGLVWTWRYCTFVRHRLLKTLFKDLIVSTNFPPIWISSGLDVKVLYQPCVTKLRAASIRRL